MRSLSGLILINKPLIYNGLCIPKFSSVRFRLIFFLFLKLRTKLMFFLFNQKYLKISKKPFKLVNLRLNTHAHGSTYILSFLFSHLIFNLSPLK
jgi:hypothetical protein